MEETFAQKTWPLLIILLNLTFLRLDCREIDKVQEDIFMCIKIFFLWQDAAGGAVENHLCCPVSALQILQCTTYDSSVVVVGLYFHGFFLVMTIAWLSYLFLIAR